MAWALSRFPDCNFIYTSYGHTLAKRQTQTVRSIIQLPHYRNVFGVSLSDDSTAKDNFTLKGGGSVYAAGSGGTITGFGAGIKGADRFGGAVIIDDAHKPDEVASSTIREGVLEWYYNTLQSRVNSMTTPIVFIGQRLHEDDLPSNLISKGGWETVIIPAIDEVGNVLHPGLHTRAHLLRMKEESPYNFASQYQQDPQPAGGGIFKPEWFYTLSDEPKILETFITADTAETDKDYNDATVFSFWGLYKLQEAGAETDVYALHWIDCVEVRIEPKDLEAEFMNFYRECLGYKVKPKIAAIEKKSTGVTLLSILKDMRGVQIMEIMRSGASGDKTSRFLEIQPIVAKKLISFPRYGKHVEMCINHMKKITANNSHRHDDVADTLYDACKIALIDGLLISKISGEDQSADVVKRLASKFNRSQQIRNRSWPL